MFKSMPNTARAAVFTAPNAPFLIREFPLRPPRPGEILVRVRMATICRSDLHSYQGLRPSPCPGILGHEIIGQIVALGGDIHFDLRGDALAVGDRVTWTEYFFSAMLSPGCAQPAPKMSRVQKYGHNRLTQNLPPRGLCDYCYPCSREREFCSARRTLREEATPLNCGAATMAA